MTAVAGALLSAQAEAPASSMALRWAGSLNMDSPTTFVRGKADLTRRVASIPSIPGMLTSMSTTSGSARRRLSTSRPSILGSLRSSRTSSGNGGGGGPACGPVPSR